MRYTYDYQRPTVIADCVVLTKGDGRIHFFKRIIHPYYTFSNEYHPLSYTFSSESNINIQKFSGFMTDFLPSNTFWKKKKTHRKPQKSPKEHYLCVQHAFCNIHVEISYSSIDG